jgi:hypothetical protein
VLFVACAHWFCAERCDSAEALAERRRALAYTHARIALEQRHGIEEPLAWRL